MYITLVHLIETDRNAEYQLINERLVAKAPKNISAEQAVSLPLTGITAYETLFDVFGISRNRNENEGKTLLIINGAGGVGSIATQIAKAYGLRVITTASRNETIEWTKKWVLILYSIIKRVY